MLRKMRSTLLFVVLACSSSSLPAVFATEEDAFETIMSSFELSQEQRRELRGLTHTIPSFVTPTGCDYEYNHNSKTLTDTIICPDACGSGKDASFSIISQCLNSDCSTFGNSVTRCIVTGCNSNCQGSACSCPPKANIKDIQDLCNLLCVAPPTKAPVKPPVKPPTPKPTPALNPGGTPTPPTPTPPTPTPPTPTPPTPTPPTPTPPTPTPPTPTPPSPTAPTPTPPTPTVPAPTMPTPTVSAPTTPDSSEPPASGPPAGCSKSSKKASKKKSKKGSKKKSKKSKGCKSKASKAPKATMNPKSPKEKPDKAEKADKSSGRTRRLHHRGGGRGGLRY